MFLTGANQKIAGDFSCIFQVGPAKKRIIQSASRARSPQTPLTEFRQILMRETYDIYLGVSINGDTPQMD